MKRKIYFFLEQLEINRGERISVTILMGFIILFSGIYFYHEPAINYDPDHYENLERIFNERSQQIEEERQNILVRYQPTLRLESKSVQPGDEQIETTQIEPVIDPAKEPVPAGIPDIININTATEEQLVTLPGIGPAYAKRIVEWREENGRFTEKEQLLEIRGIGERRLEQLLPFIEL